jgi:hypothetical protein
MVKSITLTRSKTLHVLNISTVILGSPICGSDDHEVTIVRRVWLRFSEHLLRGGFKIIVDKSSMTQRRIRHICWAYRAGQRL